jgi:hypothetical protein
MQPLPHGRGSVSVFSLAALTCDFILKAQIVQSGSAGGPAVLHFVRNFGVQPLSVMRRSTLIENQS